MGNDRQRLSYAIFDLDGVLVDTARYHYIAWRETAAGLGIPLSPSDNEQLKGVGRRESLDIILSMAGLTLAEPQKEQLANQKNERYLSLLSGLSPTDLLPGAGELLQRLNSAGVPVALASGSRNTDVILRKLSIENMFAAVANGNTVGRSKPAPDIFLAAAAMLGADPRCAAAFDDARAGVEAAVAAGMYAVGIGDSEILKGARLVLPSLEDTEAIAGLFF